MYVCTHVREPDLLVLARPAAETESFQSREPWVPKPRSGRNRPPLSLSKLIKFMGGKAGFGFGGLGLRGLPALSVEGKASLCCTPHHFVKGSARHAQDHFGVR